MLLSVLITAQLSAQTISLQEFLDSARSEHPLVEREELAQAIATQRRAGLLTAEDWRLRGRAEYYHSKPNISGDFSPSTIDEFDLSAGLERSIWKSGGNLELGWSSKATSQTLSSLAFPGGADPLQIGEPTLYENSLMLSYTQPLLRNFKGRLDRLEYDLAAYDEQLVRLQAEENEEGFLLDLAIGFIDWVLLTEQVDIAEERLRLAETERELTADKRRANLVDKVDVLRSEDAVRLASQNLVLARSQARAKQAELAVLADLPLLQNRQPDYDLYATVELPTIAESARALAEEARVLRLLSTRAQQLERSRLGFSESEKPSLNAQVGLALKGGDESFVDALGLARPDLLLGITMSHPLGARASRNAVLQTELESQQVEAQRRQLQLQLESQLHSLLIQLDDLREILELNRQQIESAREKTAEEQRLYNQGRSELNFVIQAEDNERNARLTFAQNAAGFHRMYQRYLALTDNLLPQN